MRSIAWVAVLGLSVLSQSAEAGRRHGSGGSEGSSGGSGGSIGGSGGSIGGSGGSIGGSGGSSGGFHGRLGRGRFGSSGGAYGSSGGSLGSSGGAFGSSGGAVYGGSSGGAIYGGSSGGAVYGGSSGGAVYGGSSGGAIYGGSSGGAVIVRPVVDVAPDRAYIVLHVPADATVYMLDQRMTMDGSVRNFVTPKLEQGKVYSVNVRVEWQREGQKFVARAQQKIRSGDKVEVEARLDSTGTSLVLAHKDGQKNVLELTADDAAPVASKTEAPDVANNSR